MGVCWQLKNFLALPYIYTVYQPIRSQHFHCLGWPIRSLDYEWGNGGFLLVSLSIKVWVTLGQCLSLCLTIEEKASQSKYMQCIEAIWWHFQEADWSGEAGISNFQHNIWIYQSHLVVISWNIVLSQKRKILGFNRLQIWTRGKSLRKGRYLDIGAALGRSDSRFRF